MGVPLQFTCILYVAIFLDYFLVGSVTPLLPRIALAHALSPEESSLVLSAKCFVHMASSPVVAILSYRYTGDAVLVFGVVLLSAASIGMALSSNLAGLIVSRSSQGVAVACIMVGGMSILIRVAPPDKRGKYIALAYSALGHAYLVSPLLSGLMYDYLDGQFWTFMIPGVITVVWALVSAFYFFNPNRESGTAVASSSPSLPNSFPQVLKALFSQPLCLMALVGIFSSGVTSGCIEIVVPQLITKYNGGLPVLESNLIWTLGPLAFTLVAPLAGHLIDKLGAATMFLTAQFLIALFYPLYFLMDSSLVGIGAIVMTSFALEAIMELSAYALIAQIVDSTKLVNALPVGYSLNEVSIQGGFAVGNIIGVLLAAWMGLLGVGLIMGSVNGFLAIAAVVFHTSTRVHGNHCPDQGNTCHSENLSSDTTRIQQENTHKMSSFP